MNKETTRLLGVDPDPFEELVWRIAENQTMNGDEALFLSCYQADINRFVLKLAGLTLPSSRQTRLFSLH